MSILVYGGGFNPPHLGHAQALRCASAALRPDRSLVIPDGIPPHKPFPAGSPGGETRLALCVLAFRSCPGTDVLDLSVRRDGPCYMADTLQLLRERYPGEELTLLVGTDMLLCLDRWVRAEELIGSCRIAALCRRDGERLALEQKARQLREEYGAEVILLDQEPFPASSSLVRSLLPQRQGRELLDKEVYREIIRSRLYGAKPELNWLREQVCSMLSPKRVPHVAGCEQQARLLGERWGIDPDEAAEAGILHDMTKRWSTEEQLRFCADSGILLDDGERENPQLLHARTGAVAAEKCFGASRVVCDAIRWHTTGKPNMTTFEKVIYLADMIEPTRTFPGVETIRALACQDLDAAMAEALRLSVESIRRRNMNVYKDTLEAYRWYSSRALEKKED